MDLSQRDMTLDLFEKGLVRAQMEGNTQAAESLDCMIRCHMKNLKTTKVAREGEEPKGPRTSPSEWAAALIEKVSEVAEKKPAKKTSRKKPKKSSDNTAPAKSVLRKLRQLRKVRMSESARSSLFQEILIDKDFFSETGKRSGRSSVASDKHSHVGFVEIAPSHGQHHLGEVILGGVEVKSVQV